MLDWKWDTNEKHSKNWGSCDLSDISSFHVWLVANLYILFLVFGALKEENYLEECTCKYLCSIGIL
jgi:hypothetical protein